jgi:hypothetical protein
MVEHYIGNSVHAPVTGDCNHRQRQLGYQVGIDRNQPLRAAADQHARILLDKIRPVPMVGDKVEILFFKQPISNAGHHFCVISVGKHRNQGRSSSCDDSSMIERGNWADS